MDHVLPKPTRHWLQVVLPAEAAACVDGSYCEFARGHPHPVRDLRRGDWLLLMTATRGLRDRPSQRSLYAVGQVVDDEAYVQSSLGRDHWRRAVRWLRCEPLEVPTGAPLAEQLAEVLRSKVRGRAPLTAQAFDRLAKLIVSELVPGLGAAVDAQQGISIRGVCE